MNQPHKSLATLLIIECFTLPGQDQAGRTPLQCAAYGGYITCMAVLMENNADPNIQDKEVKMYSCTLTSVPEFFLATV